MMDDNHGGDWPDANFAVQDETWPAAPSSTDNVRQNDPLVNESAPAPNRSAPIATPLPTAIAVAGLSKRHVYLFVLALGVMLTLLAVFTSVRILPRYVDVQRRYGFDLPAATTLALRSGMLQPIPGCAVILAGLTGLLARSPSRKHALATAILLLAALALPMATAAALLVPELTLV